MRKQLIQRIALGTVLILMVPLIAMQFTEEVDWGIFDFVFIGSLLMGTGLVYVYAINGIKDDARRGAFTIVLLAAMLLIWIEAAVGLFD